jgi:hypothetical protein
MVDITKLEVWENEENEEVTAYEALVAFSTVRAFNDWREYLLTLLDITYFYNFSI